MIENATILRIDRATGSGLTGGLVVSRGDDLSALQLRALADSVTEQQRYELGAEFNDANRVCFIAKDSLASAGRDAPAIGDRVLLWIDGEDESGELGEVLVAKDLVLEDLSHVQLFLKKVAT